jgi:MoaA/NifB/PqqE/SkfB family radical SAM enzyme
LVFSRDEGILGPVPAAPPLIKPKSVRLEVSSRCQLRCPSCPTTTKAIEPAVGSGVLKFDDFKNFLQANPSVRNIEISNYGEVFLNPEILKILQRAHEKRVTIKIENGANLNHVSDEVLEALVKYRVKSIHCSIDGASQETYSQYRVRGNFDRVIKNIEAINHYKALHHSPFPRLKWQFIVFGHNEHEIPKAREMAAKLGMEIYFKLTWDSDFSPIRDPEWVKRETGNIAGSRDEFADKLGVDYMQPLCHQLWTHPQINWDGKNLGCCRNFWGDFGGNVFQDGLLATVNNEKMNYARDMLLGGKPPRQDIPCTTCSIYQGMRKRKKFIKMSEVRPSLLFRIRRKIGKLVSQRLGASGG